MSSLHRLSVGGVRSFDAQEPQIITFQKPLTIIVGRNGVGKTTIIECLRYATTGSLPPGSKGDGFLHDPRLLDQSEVKANVKLQFTSLGGRDVTVTRAMSLTALASGKKTFKTLDSSMSITDGDRKATISSRCADINVEMTNQLGVSKAILENVIFCHQEDSLWPLGESLVVKKKFDDIFAATRYTQAIKEMTSLKDDKNAKLRFDRQELAHVDTYRQKAQEIRVQIEDCKRRIQDSTVSTDDYRRDLDQLQAQISEVDGQIEQILELEQQQEQRRQLIKFKTAEIDEMQNIRMFKESETELTDMLREHHERLHQAQQSHGDLDAERRRIEAELSKVDTDITRENENQGRAKEKEQNLERFIGSRNHLVREVARRLSTVVPGDKISSELADRMIESLKSRISDLEKDLTRRKEENKTRMRTLDTENQSAIEQHAKLQETIRRNNKQINDLREGNVKAEDEILRLQGALAAKEAATRHREIAYAALSEHEQATATAGRQGKIDSLEYERQQIETEFDRLNNILEKDAQHSELRARISVQQQEADRERQEAQKKLADNRARFDKIVDGQTQQLTIENCQTLIATAFNETSKQQMQLQQQQQQANDMLVRAKQDLVNKREQLQAHQHQLDLVRIQNPDIDPDVDIITKLQDLDRVITEAQRDLAFYDSFLEMYQKFITLAEKRKCCPLCERSLSDDPSEAHSFTAFTEKQQRTIAKLPSQKETSQIELDNQTANRDRLRTLQPLWTQCRELINVTIPDLQRGEAETRERIAALEKTYSDATEQLRTITIRIDTIRVLQTHAAAILSHSQKASQGQRNTDILKDQLKVLMQGTEGGMSTDVADQIRLIKQKRDAARTQLQELQMAVRRDDDNRRRFEQEVKKYEQEEKALEDQIDRRVALELAVTQNEEDIARLLQETADAESEQEDVQRTIKTLQQTRTETQVMLEEVSQDLTSRISQLRDDLRRLADACEHINTLVRSGADKDRARSQERLDQLSKTKSDLDQRLANLNEKATDINVRLSNLKEVELEVSQYLKYLRIQREVADAKKEITRLERDIHRYGSPEDLRHTKELKQIDWQDLSNKIAGAEGGIKELRRQIQTKERELLEEPYKSAEKQYHTKSIEVKTLELAVLDLDKYIKAVDKAIMSYHAIKMDEINKIMRELWVDIYQGQDIDAIEIRSEDEKGARGSYNYRVVMNKGGVSVDMRGRCSAGQKVLACLLIRLALAETFGLNCGVLALDEPTTNLDYENSERLAAALDRIIRARSRQSNFQLLLITHDENFMRKLSAHAEHYYQVKKNAQKHSIIRRIAMSEIL